MVELNSFNDIIKHSINGDIKVSIGLVKRNFKQFYIDGKTHDIYTLIYDKKGKFLCNAEVNALQAFIINKAAKKGKSYIEDNSKGQAIHVARSYLKGNFELKERII